MANIDSATVEIGPDDISKAADRLAPWAKRTPVLTCRALDERAGCSVFLKCENFQRVGAFKFRGAMNTILQLSEAEKARGVITHSSGNHAQALALAGQLTGVPVCIVMPSNAPSVKRAATAGYGARIVSCEPTQEARESTVAQLIQEEGFVLIHPYNDWRIIAGQGTAAWELFDQVAQPLDLVLAPCGGGGLLSGTALAALGKSPSTQVFGVEPSQADDAQRSLQLGSIQPSVSPNTIADGLKTSLGSCTFAVIRQHVPKILTVSEEEILQTLQFVWERVKIVIEPSSAVALAPLFHRHIQPMPSRVGVILSGGNLDVAPLIRSYR